MFPSAKIEPVDGEFEVVGFKREFYKNANAIRAVIREAFTPPTRSEQTLVKWADTAYPKREAFKAFSQNIGYDSVVTTISAYCPVSTERQGELMKMNKLA